MGNVCVDKPQELFARIEVNGLAVDGIRAMQVASLRHFDAAGDFVAAAREIFGVPLPEPLRADTANLRGEAKFILAWRSPTETLLLCADQSAFAHLKERFAGVPGGCVVDQTGGWCAVRVSGARAADLLLRLGTGVSMPGVGEARSSRLADLQVLTLCIQPGTLILLVERVYLSHFLGWATETMADL
jgi:sarcosine oxidase gamma subunit